MDKRKPYIVVILIQLIYTVNVLISKAAFNGGLPTTIFLFYRTLVASFFFIPFALVFERKKAPKMTTKILAKIFFLALLGVTFCLNVFGVGIKYTSSSVASAFTNAVPVVTFGLAVLLRMEVVKLRKPTGIVKVLGIILCLAGVLVLAFYEGPHLKSINPDHLPILQGSSVKHGPHSKFIWIVGTFLMIIFVTGWSIWIILQEPFLKEYPSKLMFSTLCSSFGTIQSFIVAMIAERDLNKWKLHLDDGLLAVSFSGIFASGLAFYLMAWCIEQKGPVFVAIWQPLSLLMTLASSSFFLGENIDLGSVLGGILMVGGLYSVLWGKTREQLENKSSLVEEINYQHEMQVTIQEHAIHVNSSDK
ncbi:hypothetical protein LUZ60_007484 [Juncus effusus]|nr:hypothetical protein LUZ60_007484 [Juncus effusus]